MSHVMRKLADDERAIPNPRCKRCWGKGFVEYVSNNRGREEREKVLCGCVKIVQLPPPQKADEPCPS